MSSDAYKPRSTSFKRRSPPGSRSFPPTTARRLIERAIDTLKHSLTEEAITVSRGDLLFLLHFRSALLPIISLPIAVVLSFIPMYLLDIPATIMSLGGIAIAIGATVDAEIVMIEACHKKLEHAPPDISKKDREKLLHEAAIEVTPAIFFSLLIIAISFIPIFGLNGQGGRLFKPLAYTKTFVMLSAAILSITLAPALRDFLLRGKIRSEANHPVSRAIIAVYKPFVYVALRRPITTLLIGGFALLSAIPPFLKLGNEFMPPLNEGDILYMPTTLAEPLDRGGEAPARAAGRDHLQVSRGQECVRQDRARRVADRSRAAVDGRDHRSTKATERVAHAFITSAGTARGHQPY